MASKISRAVFLGGMGRGGHVSPLLLVCHVRILFPSLALPPRAAVGATFAVFLQLRPGVRLAVSQLVVGLSAAQRLPRVPPPSPGTLTSDLARRRLGKVRSRARARGRTLAVRLWIAVAAIATPVFPQAGGDGDLGRHQKVRAVPSAPRLRSYTLSARGSGSPCPSRFSAPQRPRWLRTGCFISSTPTVGLSVCLSVWRCRPLLPSLQAPLLAECGFRVTLLAVFLILAQRPACRAGFQQMPPECLSKLKLHEAQTWKRGRISLFPAVIPPHCLNYTLCSFQLTLTSSPFTFLVLTRNG